MNTKKNALVERLEALLVNALWMSESDYPLTVQLFESPLDWMKFWMPFSQDRLVESVELDYLFRNAQDATLLELLQLLKTEVEQVEVFRVGEVQVDILIKGMLGKKVLLVQTVAIET